MPSLVCGNCPKIVNSDGNAKDSVKVRENMIYDYNDHSDPPDLETFKQELVQMLLKKSFFQNEPKKIYQMLKLPLIIAPSLLDTQTNSDYKDSHVYIGSKSTLKGNKMGCFNDPAGKVCGWVGWLTLTTYIQLAGAGSTSPYMYILKCMNYNVWHT